LEARQEVKAMRRADFRSMGRDYANIRSQGRLFLAVPLLLFFALPTFANHERSNGEITVEIQDKLYHSKVPQHGQVQVNFENGVATLTGTVGSLGAKEDALKAAHKVDDVNQIVDNINVRAEDVTPRQVLERARHEILTYPFYTIFDNLALEMRGDSLIVSGQVSEPYKKSDIGNFLSHIRGVGELQNDLEVLPTSIYDDQLRVAIARAIYNDSYFLRYGNQANPPIHIVVKNGNVTLEGVVNSQMDRVKAENDARFAATFFSLTNNLRLENK
jgi:hyperosmotically inducible protein